MSRVGAVAAIRFGLGPRPGECAAIAHDPKGWVLAQLERVPPLPSSLDQADPTAEQGLATLLETQRNRPPPRHAEPDRHRLPAEHDRALRPLGDDGNAGDRAARPPSRPPLRRR